MSWNKPRQNAEKLADSRRLEIRHKQKRLVLAVLIISAVSVCLFAFLKGNVLQVDSSSFKRQSHIKDIRPNIATNSAPSEAKTGKQKHGNLPEGWDKPFPPQAYWPDGTLKKHTRWNNAHTNKINKLYISEAEKVFPERGVNLELAEILRAELGQARLGTHVYDQRFTKRFLKSLEAPIVIDPSDSAYAKELKQSVIETKKAMKERYDAGEDIAQIMNDNEQQMRELSLYRKELEDQIRRIRKEKKGQFSSEDVKDLYSAANEMLEERGVKPLALPEMLIKKLELKEARKNLKGEK